MKPTYDELREMVRELDREGHRKNLEILALRKAPSVSDGDVLLCQLRAHVAPAYEAKHGKPLSLKPGWAWEMSAFIQNEFQRREATPNDPKLSDATNGRDGSKPE